MLVGKGIGHGSLIKESYADKQAVQHFEIFHQVLAAVQPLISPKKAVIAGGSVRDVWLGFPGAINDIDVFVLDTDEHEAKRIQDKCMRYLNGYPGPANYQNPLSPLPSPHTLIWNCSYPFKSVDAQFPVQIIGHTTTSAADLIKDFDWRACQFAFDGEFVWDEGKHDFYNHQLTMVNPRFPLNALRRGFYIESKYRHQSSSSDKPYSIKMKKEDILTLISMILIDPEVA